MDEDVGGHVLQLDDRVGGEYLGGLGSLDTHTPQDLELLVAPRVGHVDLEQEPVSLSLGQWVDALGLHWILSGDDAERLAGREGSPGDGHLFLRHELEHCRLHLGRGTVDLVGQDEVDEDRAKLDVELLA